MIGDYCGKVVVMMPVVPMLMAVVVMVTVTVMMMAMVII